MLDEHNAWTCRLCLVICMPWWACGRVFLSLGEGNSVASCVAAGIVSIMIL